MRWVEPARPRGIRAPAPHCRAPAPGAARVLPARDAPYQHGQRGKTVDTRTARTVTIDGDALPPPHAGFLHRFPALFCRWTGRGAQDPVQVGATPAEVVRNHELVLLQPAQARDQAVLPGGDRSVRRRDGVSGERHVRRRHRLPGRHAADASQRGADDLRRPGRVPLRPRRGVPEHADRDTDRSAAHAQPRSAGGIRHGVPHRAQHRTVSTMRRSAPPSS
jgi:hypothetical protein